MPFSIHVGFIILLLYVQCCCCTTPITIQEVHQQCFENISLAICRNDTQCSARFYQDVYAAPYSTELFTLLLEQHRSNRVQLGVDYIITQLVPPTLSEAQTLTGTASVDEMVELCWTQIDSIDSTLLSSHSTEALNAVIWWSAILRLADFCTENERFVLEEGGCQCQPGKQCQEDPPGVFLYQINSFLLAVVLSVAIFIWHYSLITREVQELCVKFANTTNSLREYALRQRNSQSTGAAAAVQSSPSSNQKPPPLSPPPLAPAELTSPSIANAENSSNKTTTSPTQNVILMEPGTIL